MKIKRLCAFLLSLCLLFSFAEFSVSVHATIELNELATVTPTEGTASTIITGGQVFSDKDNALFNSDLPEWLDGKSYLQVTIANGASNIPVSKAGWVYVLTPTTDSGSSASQEAALTTAGFSKVTTIAARVLSSGLKEKLAVMGKEVAVGDTISFKKWGVLIATVSDSVDDGDAFELNELATVMPTVGNASTVVAGGTVFTDKTYVFSSQIPAWINGQNYLKGDLGGGVYGVTVTEPGWVYVLTPAAALATTTDNSQVNLLTEAGYTQVNTLPAKVLSSNLKEELAVMGKQVNEGDEIYFGKWGILLTNVDGDYSPMEPRDTALLPPRIIYNPVDGEYVDGNRLWEGIASIAKDNESGRLWATWYSGSDGEDEYNWCVLYTSDDDGKTWIGPKMVVDPDGFVRAFDPNLWVDPDGRLWFTWNQSYYKHDKRCGVWAMYTDNPGEEEPVWSEPMRLTDGIAMNDPIVINEGKADETWMLPTALWGKYDTPELQRESKASVKISTDKGMTWSYKGTVPSYEGAQNCDENMVVELTDGRLMMLIRTEIGIEVSYSSDGGATWTPSVYSGLSKTSSRFYISRLDSGSLMLIYHDTPTGEYGRSHLTAAISEDDGKTWPYRLLFDERSAITYPDAQQDDDGNIYVIYDHDRFGDCEIIMAKFTEDDIRAGKIVTPTSKFRVIVNNNTPADPRGLLVTSVNGTAGSIVEGERLFIDDDFEFGSSLPVWLNGKDYLLSNKGSVTATASENCWVYVITPAAGEGSQVTSLTNAGFTQFATLSGDRICSGIFDTVTIMEKQVVAGDTIEFDSFGILTTSFKKLSNIELNELATVMPSTGEAGIVKLANKIFTDKTYIFGNDLPVWLDGKNYLAVKQEVGISDVKVTQPGWVYVITPMSGEFSQTAILEEKGFDKIATLSNGELTDQIDAELALMGKMASVGETISFSKWGVLVTKSDNAYITGEPRDAALKAPKILYNPTDEEYQDGNRLWQGIPSIAKDETTGRLWATWSSGSDGEDEYNWCVLYTSDDDGKTWSGPKVVVDPDGYVRAFNSNLWVDPDGRMWFTWNQSYYTHDERCGVWAMHTDNPGDEEPIWSDPVRLTDGIALNAPIFLNVGEPNETWLLSTSLMGKADADLQNEAKASIKVSTDKGVTWTYKGSIPQYTGGQNSDDNMTVALKDGNLKMFIRTDLGIEESTSYDGGTTWTPSVDAGLSKTPSRFNISRLSSGNLLLVYHNTPDGKAGRSHLTAAISEDDGETWQHKLLLDSQSDVSYPDVHQDSDGNIYIIYDHDRYFGYEILMAKITEDDIKAGAIVTPTSKLMNLVNNNGGESLSFDVSMKDWEWKSSLAYKKNVTVNVDNIASGSKKSYLVDGDESTFLRQNSGAIGSDRWVWFQVDLGSEKDVDYFKILTHQVYSAAEFVENSFIEALKIDGSVDNETFVSIIPETTYDGASVFPSNQVFEFKADQMHNARYVRIWLKIQKDPSGSTKKRVPALKEFGVYNSADYSNITLKYEIEKDGKFVPAKTFEPGVMKVTAQTYFGESFEGKELQLFAALYNEEKLESSSVVKCPIDAGAVQTFSTNISISDIQNRNLRVFVWDDNQAPLFEDSIFVDEEVEDEEVIPYREVVMLSGTEVEITSDNAIENGWLDKTGNTAKKHFSYELNTEKEADNDILKFKIRRKIDADSSNCLVQLCTPIESDISTITTGNTKSTIEFRVKPLKPTLEQPYDLTFSLNYRDSEGTYTKMGELFRFTRNNKVLCGATDEASPTDGAVIKGLTFSYDEWYTVKVELDTSKTGIARVVTTVLDEKNNQTFRSGEYEVKTNSTNPISSIRLQAYMPQYSGTSFAVFGAHIDYIKAYCGVK